MGRGHGELDLTYITPGLHDMARREWERGDIEGFFCRAPNEVGLDLLIANLAVLRARGLYEHALSVAFIATRTNNRGKSLAFLRRLFAHANRERLRAFGSPLPGPGPFTVFRGVAGVGAGRRVRGLSWTGSREQAAWFARRYKGADPAVYQVTVPERAVMLYTNVRQEAEFIVLLPASTRPIRVIAEL